MKPCGVSRAPAFHWRCSSVFHSEGETEAVIRPTQLRFESIHYSVIARCSDLIQCAVVSEKHFPTQQQTSACMSAEMLHQCGTEAETWTQMIRNEIKLQWERWNQWRMFFTFIREHHWMGWSQTQPPTTKPFFLWCSLDHWVKSSSSSSLHFVVLISELISGSLWHLSASK